MKVRCIKPVYKLRLGQVYTVARAKPHYCCEKSDPVFEIEELPLTPANPSRVCCPHCRVRYFTTAMKDSHRYHAYRQIRFVPVDDDRAMDTKEAAKELKRIFKRIKTRETA